MIIGLAFSSVNLITFFYAKEFWQILSLMALYGFGSSCVYIMASTMAADILPQRNRAMLFGAFDAVMDLGLVAGPSICFAFFSITRWPINYSFILMALPSIIALFLVFQIEETIALFQ